MKNYKWYIGILIVIGGLIYGVLQYHNLPKKVSVNASDIQELVTVNRVFIAEQKSYRAGEQKRLDVEAENRKLMIDLIKERQ